MALSLSSCPAPYLDPNQYPSTGGYIDGRYCGNITSTLECCLPCPLAEWIYPDSFFGKMEAAAWMNVPSLVCQIFLLLTYAVLPQKHSQRHYLSVGLCCSLVLEQLAYIIPLGAQPQQCYNDITPNDLSTSLICGWTGGLLEAGSTASAVWILMRSIWTHLRVCWGIEHTPGFIWIAHALAWGIPALFLAISLPITGLSYQIGPTCFANDHAANVTWFGWLIAIACIAAGLQFLTSGYCFFVWARATWSHRGRQDISNTPTSGASNTNHSGLQTPLPGRQPQSAEAAALASQRQARRRMRRLFQLQWRSIALSVVVAVVVAYSGAVYVALRHTQSKSKETHLQAAELEWGECLILSGGDKTKCLPLARKLSNSEGTELAALILESLVGIFTFSLMVRRSMFIGWWELLRHPRGFRQGSDAEEFVLVEAGTWKRGFRQTPSAEDVEKSATVTAAPGMQVHPPWNRPEPGDVGKRHATTTMFDEEEEEEGRAGRGVGGEAEEDDDDDDGTLHERRGRYSVP